ncbi:MAG: bifunctional (p)ppGpp synthetase/guanosine-3',5'-bis(diphosphate) 3'-pyrophosphohydrolase, partial [Solobacterium sp.]|nr:bifunctional (p)ppGpp synthetase/guanosine-3',5'-bis(diphosphate) 3'-pyrophosphohydrolase [Solobacterium sp.]
MPAEQKQITFDDVMEVAKTYIHRKENLELIERAAKFAEEKHEGQFRKSGDPYFVHVLNVAYILATLHVGPTTIAAGFLHDVVEDTDVTKEDVISLFGEEIAELVDSVTKIGALKFHDKEDPEYQAANHRKLFIAMAKDVR